MNHRGLVSIETQREAAPKDAGRHKNFIGLYVTPMKALGGAALLFSIVFYCYLAKGARSFRKLHRSIRYTYEGLIHTLVCILLRTTNDVFSLLHDYKLVPLLLRPFFLLHPHRSPTARKPHSNTHTTRPCDSTDSRAPNTSSRISEIPHVNGIRGRLCRRRGCLGARRQACDSLAELLAELLLRIRHMLRECRLKSSYVHRS